MSGIGKVFGIALPAFGVVALALAAAAAGGISGPCSASIAGASVAGRGTGATSTAIVVGHGATVPIVMRAAGGLTHVKISLEFAGITWVVRDKAVSTSVYRDTIPVKDYASYGVGLYKVTGTATGPGLTCAGGALVRVKGDALTSYAGIGGIIATVLGVGGVLAGGLGGGGRVRPGRLGLAMLAGLLGGAGVLVLLQEAAVVYPTLTVALLGLGGGALLGAATSVLSGLGHAVGTGSGHGVGHRPATTAL